jgi:serine phosphatase RsbU (regulator of sigma subunit)
MEQRPGNDHEQRQRRRESDRLIARLRHEAAVRDEQLADL